MSYQSHICVDFSMEKLTSSPCKNAHIKVWLSSHLFKYVILCL